MSEESLMATNISEFTNNVVTDTIDYTVTGDGIFDKLMDTATKHLKAQFESNRIREEDYASAYIQIYQTTLQAALEAWLKKDQIKAQIDYTNAQIEESKEKLKLLAKQLELLEKQLETEDARKALYRRQIEGFDEDYKQKILKIMMESWAVGFSVAKDSFEATGIPAPMQKTTIDDLYNQYILTEFDKYNYGRPGITE